MDIGQGRYRLVRRLGRGGTGAVYQAVDQLLGRAVAIKVLHNADNAPLLVREAGALAHLNHPSIVTVHDLLREEGRAYLVLELVEGCDLEQWIAEHGTLNPAQAWHVVRSMGLALSHAHRQGVLHCDLKPANVLISTGGEIKLTDFTLARTQTAEGFAGTAGCTPGYAAPEQWAGAQVDPRTDVYGLGALVLRVLDGSQLQDRDRQEMRRIAARAMARNPADRYGTVDEMLAELPGVPADATALAPVANMPALTRIAPRDVTVPVRRRWLVPAVALVGLLTGGAAVTRLSVQAAPARVTVPDLVATQASSARLVAASIDLRARIVRTYSPTAPAGTVIRQWPAPSSKVSPGAGIRLLVSRGPAPVIVPQAIGSRDVDVIGRLHQLGFRVAVISSDSLSHASGSVLDETPPAGTSQLPGTTITITVSRKPWWWPF